MGREIFGISIMKRRRCQWRGVIAKPIRSQKEVWDGVIRGLKWDKYKGSLIAVLKVM